MKKHYVRTPPPSLPQLANNLCPSDPQALESLTGVITPGLSTPGNPPAALVPPHTHIRLITTLITHPYLTTQLSRNEPTPTAPITAFLLLRRILKLIGPLNANFSTAWAFDATRSRGTRRAKKEIDRDNSPSYTTDDYLASELATTDSPFALAEDLWIIVGWAFTCSVSHPKRWRWWKLELEVLLDVLEADWEDRLESTKATRNPVALGNPVTLENSLIVRMLPDTKGSAGYKKVIRAILANSTGGSLNNWCPVYKDELSTKRPRKKNMGSLDNSFIGDSDSDSDHTTPITSKIKAPSEDTDMLDPDEGSDDEEPGLSTAAGEWGGMDALVLRQRWLTLLSSVAFHECYIPIEDLYHEYQEMILRFSISSFVLFTNTLVPADIEYRSSLNQLILATIISSHSPAPRKDESDNLTAKKIIERYLPFPANTNGVIDNAKVAVLLESMLRMLVTEVGMRWSEELEKAVEVGIGARAAKVSGGGRRAEREAEREARWVWEGAEERLRGMVDVLKMKERRREERRVAG